MFDDPFYENFYEDFYDDECELKKEKRLDVLPCYKLGEALKYTLLYELKAPQENRSLDCFKTAICCMFLEGIIGDNTVRFFQKYFLSVVYDEYDYEEMCRLMAVNLMEDEAFRNYVKGTSGFLEALDALEKVTIKYWIAEIRDKLFKIIPHARYRGDELYFFEKNDRYPSLMKIYTHNIFNEWDFDDAKYKLSDKYYGFIDYKTETNDQGFYYTYTHSKYHYCKYNDNEQQEMLCRGVVLGFAGDALVKADIHEEELWVKYVMPGNEILLEKYDENKNYEVTPEYILVSFKIETRVCEKPYRLYYDGTKKECSYSERKNYLWQRLCPVIICELQHIRMTIIRHEILKREMHKEPPKKFTIRYFDELFQRKYMIKEAEENSSIDNFKEMLAIINRFINKDDDILELLYVLMDVSFRTKRTSKEIVFPDNELISGLVRLKALGQLEELLSSPELLKGELLLWLGKKLEKTQESRKLKLGTFCIKDDELQYDLYALEKCIVLGGMMIPPTKKYESVISLDLNTGIYYFHHNGDISEDKVERLFNLTACNRVNIVWVKDGC